MAVLGCGGLARLALFAFAGLLAGGFAWGEARAMGVSPTQVEMVSAGRAARGQITVSNDGRERLPVEITMERLSLDENGHRRASRGGDSFLVFPPQALIAPGATQVFRVQWVGEPRLAKSESYMLYVNQVPVRMPKGRSGVQVAISMGVVINVAPPTGSPALNVVGSSVAVQSGRRRPVILVENPSNVHALLPQSRIHLRSAGWSRTVLPNELSAQIGVGLVEPGKRRRFVLPVDLPANARNIEAVVDLKPRRR